MNKKQFQGARDFSHSVIEKIKSALGLKKKEPSLLCHSLAHLNGATWLERISSNGILSEYIVKR
jgi:hypothetical protein